MSTGKILYLDRPSPEGEGGTQSADNSPGDLGNVFKVIDAARKKNSCKKLTAEEKAELSRKLSETKTEHGDLVPDTEIPSMPDVRHTLKAMAKISDKEKFIEAIRKCHYEPRCTQVSAALDAAAYVKYKTFSGFPGYTDLLDQLSIEGLQGLALDAIKRMTSDGGTPKKSLEARLILILADIWKRYTEDEATPGKKSVRCDPDEMSPCVPFINFIEAARLAMKLKIPSNWRAVRNALKDRPTIEEFHFQVRRG